jgi:protein SCO1/2
MYATNRTAHVLRLMGFAAAMTAAAVVSASAQAKQPMAPESVPSSAPLPILKDVGIDQKLDQPVPVDATFVDETGRTVRLGSYFAGGKPVVLQMAYYRCPMLCTIIQRGLVAALKTLNVDAGKDFTVVVVSIDPGETPALAEEKRQEFLERYDRADVAGGVHFLTGREDAIKALASAVGFRYTYDPSIGQYAHPAAVMVLTPEARVSRYLFGVEFAPRDLKFALMEASDNRIGSVVDQALLYCYHYDPASGKYGFAIMTVIRIGAILTLLALGIFIVMHLRRDRRQVSAVDRTATGTR